MSRNQVLYHQFIITWFTIAMYHDNVSSLSDVNHDSNRKWFSLSDISQASLPRKIQQPSKSHYDFRSPEAGSITISRCSIRLQTMNKLESILNLTPHPVTITYSIILISTHISIAQFARTNATFWRKWARIRTSAPCLSARKRLRPMSFAQRNAQLRRKATWVPRKHHFRHRMFIVPLFIWIYK